MKVSSISNRQNYRQKFGIKIKKNEAYKELYRELNFDLKIKPEKVDNFFKAIEEINPFKTFFKKLEFLPLEKEQQVSHECCGRYKNGVHYDGVRTIVLRKVYLPFCIKGASKKPVKQKMLLYTSEKNLYSDTPPIIHLNSTETNGTNTFLQNIINKFKENYQISGKMAGVKLSKKEIKRLDNIMEIGRDDIQSASLKSVLKVINLPENQYNSALKLMPLKSTKITQEGLGFTNEQTVNLFNFEQILQLAKLDDNHVNLAIRLASLKDKHFGTVYQGDAIVSLLTREAIQKQLSELCSNKITRKTIDDIHALAEKNGGGVKCCYFHG